MGLVCADPAFPARSNARKDSRTRSSKAPAPATGTSRRPRWPERRFGIRPPDEGADPDEVLAMSRRCCPPGSTLAGRFDSSVDGRVLDLIDTKVHEVSVLIVGTGIEPDPNSPHRHLVVSPCSGPAHRPAWFNDMDQ
jgi:hypothetical protein